MGSKIASMGSKIASMRSDLASLSAAELLERGHAQHRGRRDRDAHLAELVGDLGLLVDGLHAVVLVAQVVRGLILGGDAVLGGRGAQEQRGAERPRSRRAELI